MTTILVKNLPEGLLEELKRLKAELGCKTWADFLTKLAKACEEQLQEDKQRDKTGTRVKNLAPRKAALAKRQTKPDRI